MAKRAYKERFYPTPEQAALLKQSFGCARFVWNNTLAYRTEAYQHQGQKVAHATAERRLVCLKKEYPWLTNVSSVVLQQVLRDQKVAFDNFFNPKLDARYPRFKRKYSRQSIRLTKAAFRYRDGEITIAKTNEPLPVRWSRPLPCAPSSVSISKDSADRYFISCLCEFSPKALSPVSNTVGVDIGLDDLFATSEGRKSEIGFYTKKHEEKLAYFQSKLSKKTYESNNSLKLKKKIARIHAKIADCRRDAIHKATRTLINENQVLCVRSLKSKELAEKKCSMSNNGWGEFVRQLTYKADWAGRQLIKVNGQFLKISECSSCTDSAKTIQTVGLTGIACGAT